MEQHQLPASASAEATQLRAGQRLGKYEIIERLAQGGMAEIFLARASGLLGFQKLVVIKRILPHLASKNDFIQMFLDEARIAATLNHPSVVQTYEVGVHSNSYFIAMEYLAGEDLRSIARTLKKRQERLPVEHALTIVSGIAAGLHYAHEKRDMDGKPLEIVHRDVTPQNVIVLYEGGVKLLDFGIAKASNRINETRTGSFKGKVPYLSPEQCRGDQVDRRTDLFSLGILLWELTLGKRLFVGQTDFQILKQIAEGAVVRPRSVDPDYDPELDAIVMRALEPEPSRRYQTARELQEAIEELAHQRRWRLSPMALGDYMHTLFADKVGAWRRVSEQADAAEVEAHFATVAAEREADLREEEREIASAPVSERRAFVEPEPSELPSLPGDVEVQAPARRGRSPAAWIVAGGLLASLTVFGVRLWPKLRERISPPPLPAAIQPAPRPPEPPRPAPPEPAVAEITTIPAGATLVLDGETLAQRSPARLEGLAPATVHTLVVRLAGYAQVAQEFTLEPGEVSGIEVELARAGSGKRSRAITKKRPEPRREAKAPPRSAAAVGAPAPSRSSPAPSPSPPAAPAPAGEGTLVVASSPWCQVIVDGQPRGTTPVSLKLKAGEHEVVLKNPEFRIQRTLSVEVAPGQTVRKRLDFAPEDR